MYQVNINLHSQVPNTKTAFLTAPPSSSHHFLPNLRQPNPPPHRLWPPSAWSETAADFLLFLFSLFFFSCFPSPVSISSTKSKTQAPAKYQRYTSPGYFHWTHWLTCIVHTCDTSLLWPRRPCSFFFTEKWQFETNTFSNLRQMHFAIWDKYILQYKTNILYNLRQIYFAIWEKYTLQFETNTFCYLR